jgi:hypothetical protein
VEPYLHSPNTPSWRGVQLKEAQGQLHLYLKDTLSNPKQVIARLTEMKFI